MKKFKVMFLSPKVREIYADNIFDVMKEVPNDAENVEIGELEKLEGYMENTGSVIDRERITIVDVGEAIGHLKHFLDKTRDVGLVKDKEHATLFRSLKILSRASVETLSKVEVEDL